MQQPTKYVVCLVKFKIVVNQALVMHLELSTVGGS